MLRTALLFVGELISAMEKFGKEMVRGCDWCVLQWRVGCT
jgi:hypothetical protein